MNPLTDFSQPEPGSWVRPPGPAAGNPHDSAARKLCETCEKPASPWTMERQDHHVAADQRGSRNETPRLRSIEKQLNPELIPLQGPQANN